MHEAKLIEPPLVGAHRTVGAHRDTHPLLKGQLHAASSPLGSGLRPLRSIVIVTSGERCRQRRDEPRVVLDHRDDGVPIEEEAVLDTAHASPCRCLCCAGTVGVGHHVAAVPCGFCHDLGQLIVGDLLM